VTYGHRPTPRGFPRRQMLLSCLALATSAGLAGCGVGAEPSPHALNAASVPDGLLRHHPKLPSPSEHAGATSRVTVWLEGGNQHLVPVHTNVPWPSTVGALLNALAKTPTERQSDEGLVSPASSVGPLTSEPPQHGVVEVDLPVSFENLGGGDQLIAVAQIVFTLTAFPGVKGVSFLVGGRRVQVPNASGKLEAGGLTRRDYSALTSESARNPAQ
jgi:Sporulation and spore germination